jgi:hypothetical protein
VAAGVQNVVFFISATCYLLVLTTYVGTCVIEDEGTVFFGNVGQPEEGATTTKVTICR